MYIYIYIYIYVNRRDLGRDAAGMRFDGSKGQQDQRARVGVKRSLRVPV